MASWRAGRPPGPLSSLGLITVCAVVAVDQATKLWATAALPAGRAIDLLPILALLRVENTGIAFSIFAGSGVPLVLVSLVVTAAVIAFWLTARDGGQIAAAGFALILGGALGNLIDRLFRAPGFLSGEVVDFVRVGAFPTFNVADSAVTIGAVLLLVWGWRDRDERRDSG